MCQVLCRHALYCANYEGFKKVLRVHTATSCLFLLGSRTSWPVATAPRGPNFGQVRSDVPRTSVFGLTQPKQSARPCNTPASGTAWSLMQPPARPFG